MTGEKKLTRREREKLRQKEEILDAALDLFCERGFQNVSMLEIAKKSEFAVGTLYKFFNDKEDLYRTLMLEQSNKFHEALNKAINETDNEIDKLKNFVKTKSRIFMENAKLIRLYFAETKGASYNIKAGLDKEIRDRHKKFLERIAKIFESGIKKGIFKNIAEPYHLAIALDGICNAFLFSWLENPEKNKFMEEGNYQFILNILFKGLINE